MYNKQYIGLDLTGFEDKGTARPVSKVTLLVDNDHAVTAGDGTGLELSAACPYATQEMAEAILRSVQGYRYRMLSASAANLDPAAELGDGLTASGVYSVLAGISDDGSGYPDLEAPGEAELEDEFPMEGPVTQSFNRQMATARASITRLSDEIELRVEKDGVIAAINLSSEEATIRAEKISLEGLVTVNRTFQIDEDGYLRCTGGSIGGFSIGQSAIYNGLDSLGGTEDGVYVGTDGIALGGGKFKVTSGGALSSKSGTFERVTITDSSFDGSLEGATGSISGVTGSYEGSIYSDGTFTGTHSGGSLSSTYGSFYGGHYSGLVSACNLGGTSLSMTSGGSSNVASYSNGIRMYGSSNAHVTAGSVSLSLSSSRIYGNTSFHASGDISCDGEKSRAMKTKHFDVRLLQAFETPLPTFSDYGTGRLDEDGVCFICIDPIFAETVNGEYRPTVFLTPYGDGALHVDRAEHDVITVKGTPGLRFAWETRYAQANASIQRLRVLDFDGPGRGGEYDFETEAAVDLEHRRVDLEASALNELTSYAAAAIDYGAAGYEYFTEFERRLTAA